MLLKDVCLSYLHTTHSDDYSALSKTLRLLLGHINDLAFSFWLSYFDITCDVLKATWNCSGTHFDDVWSGAILADPRCNICYTQLDFQRRDWGSRTFCRDAGYP